MKIREFTRIAGCLALLAYAGPASAQALAAVGQILSVQGSGVVIFHGDESRPEAASVYDYLLPGDRVQVRTSNGSAVIYDVATHRSHAITEADGAVSVGGRAPGALSAAANDLFRGFETLFRSPRQPIPVDTEARGIGRNPTFATDILLPEGKQFLPAGATAVAPIWRGGSALVSISNMSGEPVAAASSEPFASVVLPVPPLSGSYLLAVGESGPRWKIVTISASEIPTAEQLKSLPMQSDAERVVRAAWILRDGPASWRLFALTELANLADRNYAADRLWHAVRAGEFPAPKVDAVNDP